MEPQLKTLLPLTLVGLKAEMSLSANSTGLLWRNFMVRRHELNQPLDNLYSLQLYPENYFENFSPTNRFIKWAAVEYSDSSLPIPSGLETLEVPGGEYAVFLHKGPDVAIFQFIYSEWLPASGYKLANKPHFEILNKDYIPGHPDSTEEIWIPITN